MATELKFMVKKGAKVPVYKTSGAAGADEKRSGAVSRPSGAGGKEHQGL